jgi:D-serine deaminase-like pyridoxal phosphate-dependent protein
MRAVNEPVTLGWRAQLPAVRHALGLLGQPGSRWALPTPALVLDIDAFDRNVALMAARTKDGGLTLRPHAKSHKSSVLGRRQLDAGAVGLCCAKLGEAEALLAGGVGSILVTSPLVDESLVGRLGAVAGRAEALWLASDGHEAIDLAARAADAGGSPIGIVIDIDVGLGRTGVRDAATALALAQRVVDTDGLFLAGVQGYGGAWQHVVGREERRRQMEKGIARLSEAVAAIEATGHAVAARTGGGTGTVLLDAELGVLNDVQPGSYVFMDVEYRDALGDDPEGRYEPSLFVQSQVISANNDRWVTLDAGLKAFATDADAPVLRDGSDHGTYAFFGDEHGRLTRGSARAYRPGDRVELMTPHCDPTVDRYDVYHLVRDDVLVDIVAIDARGRAQ